MELTFTICTHCTSATDGAVLTAGRRAQDAVVGMCFHMLLQVLRTFERLATEIALVRLQWNVDANVRGDVVTLHSRGAACAPLARQVQVVCAFATDMALAYMILRTC